MDPDKAIEQAHEIVRLIDEDVPERAYDNATDFFEDIRKSASDVEETITNTGRVTSGQQQALDNWEAGVRKWIRE